jgi:hypothetical protein
MSLTKLYLAGNNKLFPIRESLVSDIPAMDKPLTFSFTVYSTISKQIWCSTCASLAIIRTAGADGLIMQRFITHHQFLNSVVCIFYLL